MAGRCNLVLGQSDEPVANSDRRFRQTGDGMAVASPRKLDSILWERSIKRARDGHDDDIVARVKLLSWSDQDRPARLVIATMLVGDLSPDDAALLERHVSFTFAGQPPICGPT